MSAAIQTREQWLEERHRYLGASDMAAILGVDLYRTPLDVFNEKLGLSEPFNGNAHTKRGNKLEEIAAREYSEITGRKVHRHNAALVHPDYPFVRGHLDRKIVGERRPLEIKCPSVGVFSRIKREGLPISWVAQLQTYLMLFNAPIGDWAVFNADRWELLTFDVEADPGLHEQMLTAAVKFWTEHVETGIPPAPLDGDKTTIEFQKIGGEVVKRADPEFAEAAELLREAKQLEVDSKELIDVAKRKIKEVIGGKFGRYEGAGLRLYYSMSPGHMGFDKKALAAAHPEISLADFEKRGTPFEVLKPYWIGGQ